MHQSIIARLACAFMVPCAALMGWVFHAFMYELEAVSPVIPLSFGAIIVMMIWAVMDLTDV